MKESNVIPYNSIEDARKSVDLNIMSDKQTLSDHLNKRLKDEYDRTYIKSTKRFNTGQIIKSLDIRLRNKSISGELSTLLNNRTYKDFVNYVKNNYNEITSEAILDVITDPEKAGVFVYMLANN